MAKKKPELTADEAVEQKTLEANVKAEEAAERAPEQVLESQDYPVERTVDERVAAVFSAPEPADVATFSGVWVANPVPVYTITLPSGFAFNPTALAAIAPDADAWLAEARAARDVFIAGNAISPDELKRLVNQAIGLVERYRA